MVALPDKQTCPSLADNEIKLASERVKDDLQLESLMAKTVTTKSTYNDYIYPKKACRLGNTRPRMAPLELHCTKHFL